MGPLVREALPTLAAELEGLLREDGEPNLASQVSALHMVERCRCSDSFCAMFYTAPPPAGAWGKPFRNVALLPAVGDLILDVLDERIVAVEVLDNPQVREVVRRLWP